ncbi:MAG: ExbD/TolR family protein [Verrucomicrobiota bacterium]
MVYQPPADDDKPDLTPMIDVVFLLIVFFMVAAVLIQKEKVELDLPISPTSEVPESIRNRETISVNQEGSTYLGMRQMEVDQIAQIVRERNQEVDGYQVYLRIDEGTPHKHVQELISALAAQGVFNVVFATYQS